jgi:hypothetical protein
VICTDADAPEVSEPTLHVIVGREPVLQAGLAETKVTLAGRVSVIVVGFEVDGPLLVACNA